MKNTRRVTACFYLFLAFSIFLFSNSLLAEEDIFLDDPSAEVEEPTSMTEPTSSATQGLTPEELRSRLAENGVPEGAANALVDQLEMARNGQGCYTKRRPTNLYRGGVCNLSVDQNQRRCYVVNFETGRVENREVVAIGDGRARGTLINPNIPFPGFSNRHASEQTALGPVITGAIERRSSRHPCQYDRSYRVRVHGLSSSNSATTSRGVHPIINVDPRVWNCPEFTEEAIASGQPYPWSTGSPTMFGERALAMAYNLGEGAILLNYSPDEQYNRDANYDCGNPLTREDTIDGTTTSPDLNVGGDADET